MRRASLMQHFHLVTLFDMTLTFTWHKTHAYTLCLKAYTLPKGRLRPLEGLLAEFGVAAAICTVSVADRAKDDDFELWRDLNLTCDLKVFFNFLLKKYPTSATSSAGTPALRGLMWNPDRLVARGEEWTMQISLAIFKLFYISLR